MGRVHPARRGRAETLAWHMAERPGTITADDRRKVAQKRLKRRTR